jgi:glycosyltransferase involved in cell wall biosynthesis
MKLSIITPCTRVMNLPAIYASILEMNSKNVEWIIVYDSNTLDKRILEYKSFVPIKLFNIKKQKGDSTASRQRNLGIEKATGDYLYFLDDDNLVHPLLYEKIKIHAESNTLLIFNRFSINRKRAIKKFDLKYNVPGYIDTAQIVVPSTCKSRWDNSIEYIDEYPYICKLINELGEKNIKFVDRIYSYRNYLRRYKV